MIKLVPLIMSSIILISACQQQEMFIIEGESIQKGETMQIDVEGQTRLNIKYLCICYSKLDVREVIEKMPAPSYIQIKSDAELLDFNEKMGVDIETHDFDETYLLAVHVAHAQNVLSDLLCIPINENDYQVVSILNVTQQEDNITETPFGEIYLYETPKKNLIF